MTVREQVDEVTGMATKVVVETKDPNSRPRISIKDDSGKTAKLTTESDRLCRYFHAVGANIVVSEGSIMYPGDVMAKIPRRPPRPETSPVDCTRALPSCSKHASQGSDGYQ